MRNLARHAKGNNAWGDIPYETLRNFVYLGPHPTKNLKRRARKAGLRPLTVKQWRAMHGNQQAIIRMLYGGRWYDTVKF